VQKERRPFYLGVALLLLAGAAFAAGVRPPDEAAAIGVAAVFAGLVLSCYYWVVLVLLALRRGNGGAVGVLSVNAAALVTALMTSDTQVIFGVFSWGLLVVFAALMVPDASRTARQWFTTPRPDHQGRATPGGSTPPVRKPGAPGKRSGSVACVDGERSMILPGTASRG
jgi:hypothetical protein